MLSKSQKETLRRITLYNYACKEKDGVPIDTTGHKLVVLSHTEIKEAVFSQILRLGFSKVEQVAPCRANCIIRVFKKSHYHYTDNLIYNLYGAACFTRKFGQWVSSPCGKTEDFKIVFSKYIVRHFLFQDEYINFDVDFFDCYVKVS